MHVGMIHVEKSNTHVSLQEGKKPFKCVNCDSKFHKEIGLIMEKYSFKCDSCNSKYDKDMK